MLLLYWLALFPVGVVGLVARGNLREPEPMLLASLIVLNLLSIAAVLYWSDLRFLVEIDLLLGCFAGWAYDEILVRLNLPRAHKCA